MQTLYKNILLTTVVLLAILLNGCTKNFGDYNKDPNAVTIDELLADNNYVGNFIKHMQQNIIPIGTSGTGYVNSYQVAQNLCADVYSGYMGASNNWNSNNNNTTYGLVTGWYGEAFRVGFIEVLPAWVNVKNAVAQKAADQFAVAQILKVEAMHRVTDIYGPLPYFNAGTSGLTTLYDSQDNIYYSFFEDLNSAIQTLTEFVATNPAAKPLSIHDLVYKGDYVKWIKFANSLKLRLAMRMAYSDPAKAKQYAEEAVNNTYGVIINNTDNAIVNGIAGHPLNTISAVEAYNDVKMGANMESFLKGYSDPRMGVYFQQGSVPSSPGYHGIRNGITISDASRYRQFSTLTLLKNVVWLTAAEVSFLRAEGALRGWAMGGTSQTFYETGIRKSFEQWSVGAVDTYISGTGTPAPYVDPVSASNNITSGSQLSTITVKWDDAANFETKLEKLITQKWIAMFPEGQEAWSEFRRTNYPKIFPVRVNNSGGSINTNIQIRRMPFPQSEYLTNAAGVQSGVQKLGGNDNGGTRLWWDKKP